MKETFKSPLHKMVSTTPTCLWNDSCSIEELSYSIGHFGMALSISDIRRMVSLIATTTRW